jgi:hypothetical protein
MTGSGGVAMSTIGLIQAKWVRRPVVDVRVRHAARCLGVVVLTIWAALLSAPAQVASAQPCPDIEVVFARGTSEPPGVGGVGQAFIEALRSDVGGRSVDVYPVNYPAGNDFGGGIDFARTVVDGIRDEATHVESTAANCPNTRMVLGGFSQGAVVTGFVTSPSVPKEVPPEFVSYIPQPMPPEVANHVAAVALFGTPSDQFMRDIGAPPVTVGPLYQPKTIQLCDQGDTICNGAPAGNPSAGHAAYAVNGMVGQAADFVARRL